MARTSRKNIVAPVKSPPTPKSEYSAALYARISVEDERKREARIRISAYLMCIAMTMYPGRIFNGRSFPA